MAKTTAPLLSLGASGKIGDTLVAMTWKGLNTMRQWVKPANPQSAAQVTQRGLMADVVAAFRNYFTSTVERSAWNRSATASGESMSGFNIFTRNAVKIAASDPDATFANGCVAFTGNTAKFTVKNLDDGAAGDESGSFEIWVGSKANSLLLNGTATTYAGEITSAKLGDTDDVVYVKIRKGGYDRSGIHQITLIA